MNDHLLVDIGICISGAAAIGIPAYFAGFPLLLAYLAAGVLLGPHLGLAIIQDSKSIDTLAEIGLVLLMFILGLEIDVRKLIHAGKAVLLNGLFQFLGCFALGWIFFSLLARPQDFGPYGLLYLSVACALSSTLIVVKILSEKMELDTLMSRISIGTLVIQDLWAIGFLAIQPSLNDIRIQTIGMSGLKIILLVSISVGLARFILPALLRSIGKQPDLLLVVGMAWCFGLTALAHSLQLSMEMGSLIAGVCIASFPYHADLAAKISSLRDFFVTLFFVALGLRIPVPDSASVGLTLLVILFVLFSRILTVFPILHVLGYGNRTSLIPALNLSQLSEFSLVLAGIGVAAGHIKPDLMYVFIIALAVTALLSSIVIPKAHQIYRALNPLLEFLNFKDQLQGSKENEVLQDEETPPEIVLLGFYRDASSLLHELGIRFLDSLTQRIMIVDLNPEVHHKLQNMKIKCKYGDISHLETLRGLGLDRSDLLVCTIPDSSLKGTSNLQLLRTLKKLYPKSRVVVTAERFDLAERLYQEGADYVYIPRSISAYYLADVIERLQRDQSPNIRESGLAHIQKRNEVIP